jgi:hypothetical protein
MDDVSSGAVAYISTLTDVLALIGAFPADDSNPANRNVPWVFKEDILCTVEGSSKAAIVCRQAGGWGAARPLNTERFMRLMVDLWVDPDRDSGFNVQASSGAVIKKADQIFSVLNSHLHRRNPQAVAWGDLVTTSCDLLAEPGPWEMVPDGDYCIKGTATYGVLSYGWTDVAV